MPELPDIEAYLHALRPRVVNSAMRGVRVLSPFLLRTVDPPLEQLVGRRIESLGRLGKRIVLRLEDDLLLVLHLMIAGRLRWTPDAAARAPGRITLAELRFEDGALFITEAGTKKRAALHVLRGEARLAEMDPGGLELLEATEADFAARLASRRHTLKRALTDPRLFSGIGNAYSDEILHAARLSPLKWTDRLTPPEVKALFQAARDTLAGWTERLRTQFGDRFPGPGQITAFRPGFAVHGRFGQPCPACGTAVQRIRYAENETNYCPRCQTDGRVLADRSLSRLLRDDWPRTVEELEAP